MNTTKPEWEEEFNNIANSWEEPQFSFERRDALQAHMVKMVFQFKELFASHLTGTVKVEELKERIKALPELTDSEGHSAGGFIERDSVLALLDEKK